MGAGIFGLAVLLPATLIALVAALWFAISAARAGHTPTAIASLGGLLIASPFVLASFAQRPQADEENPIFMIECGVFPSALLAVLMLSAGLVLRRRYVWLMLTVPLLASLGFLGFSEKLDYATAARIADSSLRWLGPLGAATLAAYPLIWVFAFRELSEYATPCLAKPEQG
jgi:hypothetical protein